MGLEVSSDDESEIYECLVKTFSLKESFNIKQLNIEQQQQQQLTLKCKDSASSMYCGHN